MEELIFLEGLLEASTAADGLIPVADGSRLLADGSRCTFRPVAGDVMERLQPL